MYSYYRGTVFQFVGQVQDDGVVQNLTGATLQAQVSDMNNNLIANPTVTVTNAVGGIVSVTVTGSTITWPLGKARIDFLLTLPNNALPIASDPAFFRIINTPMLG
jgi:hypothetical protein